MSNRLFWFDTSLHTCPCIVQVPKSSPRLAPSEKCFNIFGAQCQNFGTIPLRILVSREQLISRMEQLWDEFIMDVLA